MNAPIAYSRRDIVHLRCFSTVHCLQQSKQVVQFLYPQRGKRPLDSSDVAIFPDSDRSYGTILTVRQCAGEIHRSSRTGIRKSLHAKTQTEQYRKM